VTNGGQLNASTSGQGNGGNINITTAQLRVSDGSRVNVSTSGTGNGGNLTVNASQSVQLIGTSPKGFSSSLFTLSSGKGNAGELTINTGTLLVRDGAQIVAGTFRSGNGGNVTINASQDVQLLGTSAIGLPSRLRVSAEEGSSGNAGNLTINTGTLLLRDAAQVGTGTFGSGNGGKLTVNASQDVQLIGSSSPVNGLFIIGTGLFASTQAGSTGNGGDLTINTSNLLVRGGAQITTGTYGTGNGGKLTVNASQEVQLIGTTTDGQFAGSLLATADEGSSGKAGDLTINTGTLLVRDGAGVGVSTLGSGKGGNLTVKASDSVQLSGAGGLFARSTSGSTAGNVTVETRQMSVQDGAQVTVSSPQGQAGNLNITANSLSLNRGKLTAETGASGAEGANINLSGLELVLMQNESLISAQAFNQANGGNISIDTKLLVALPAVGSNGSDIIASAGRGNGGKITINADGILGIRERKAIPGNRTNDIDASSEFGTPGTVALNTSFDPSRGLSQLPEEPVDPTRQISQQCAARGEDKNKFTITGRGGLPQSPTELISPDMILDDFGTPVVSNPPTGESIKPSPTSPSPQLVEAQGWVVDDNGVVTLVAAAPTVTPHSPVLVPPSCQIRGTTGKVDEGVGSSEQLVPVRYR
jgi:large exoprotein involved in heme utilization and adhesion